METPKFGVNMVTKERVVTIPVDEFKKVRKELRSLNEANNRLEEENRQLKNKIKIMAAKICGQSDEEISKLELEMLHEDVKRMLALKRTAQVDPPVEKVALHCVSSEEKIDG